MTSPTPRSKSHRRQVARLPMPRSGAGWGAREIEQGWRVVGSDGVDVGTVAQVEGDKHDDASRCIRARYALGQRT